MNDQLCTLCGSVVIPVPRLPGSRTIEIILYLGGIVPGIIYSLWRLSEVQSTCPVCGSHQLIPCNSPRAAELLAPRRTAAQATP